MARMDSPTGFTKEFGPFSLSVCNSGHYVLHSLLYNTNRTCTVFNTDKKVIETDWGHSSRNTLAIAATYERFLCFVNKTALFWCGNEEWPVACLSISMALRPDRQSHVESSQLWTGKWRWPPVVSDHSMRTVKHSVPYRLILCLLSSKSLRKLKDNVP